MKNKIFQSRDLCLRALDTNSICAKSVRRNEEKGLAVDIEVDGGINLDNVEAAVDAGANIIVAGSAVFKNDIGVNVKSFLEKLLVSR